VVVPADLSDTTQLADLVPAALDAFGRVDVVVNNVGGTLPMPAMMTTDEFLEEAFHFNVTTAMALSRAAIPHLLKQDNSSIINVSSAMGRLRERGYLAYGTAKAALAHLTRLLAADVAPRIRVNGLFVGSVLTSALEIVAANPEIKQQMEEATPLRRLGEPEDVAAAMLYLASPAGSFVTGKLLEIDGGIEAPNLILPLPDLEPED
jgi:7-alpha-hydroxysteroid dehydrogenase